jgi:acyl carrier protein
MNNTLLLKTILAKCLEVEIDKINDSTSMDTLSEWDSIKHLRIVLALEDTFNINLTEMQSVEIISFELIKLVLKEHGVQI